MVITHTYTIGQDQRSVGLMTEWKQMADGETETDAGNCIISHANAISNQH